MKSIYYILCSIIFVCCQSPKASNYYSNDNRSSVYGTITEIELCPNHSFTLSCVDFHASFKFVREGQYDSKNGILSLSFNNSQRHFYKVIDEKLFYVQEADSIEKSRLDFLTTGATFKLTDSILLVHFKVPAITDEEDYRAGKIDDFDKIFTQFEEDNHH